MGQFSMSPGTRLNRGMKGVMTSPSVYQTSTTDRFLLARGTGGYRQQFGPSSAFVFSLVV